MKFQLSKPLKWCYVTQPFYANYADFYSKLGMKGHGGIDLRAERGTEVYAMHDGKIIWAGEYAGFGINVSIETEELFDDKKYQTVYAHLQEVKVINNQMVKAGDLIGLSDNTGKYTTADHLHISLYEIDKNGTRLNRDNGYFGGIDPAPFFSDRGWDLLPVQRRYERFYNPANPKERPWHAYLSEKKVALSLMATLRALPSNEQINACTYGAWPKEWVLNDAFFPIYATLTYADYKAGKKPPILTRI